MRVIYEKALAWGIGWASNREIDEMNILRASLLAMERAYSAMKIRADEAIVDGLHVPHLDIPCRALVKADSSIPAVMAASILAKTARDRMMMRYAWLYPEYGYEKHKGYPTKTHFERIAQYGCSPIQRHSFRLDKPKQWELGL